MDLALSEARLAAMDGEVPVGAVALVGGTGRGGPPQRTRAVRRPDRARRNAGSARCRHERRRVATVRSHVGRHPRAVPHVRRSPRCRQGASCRLRDDRPAGGSMRDAVQPLRRSAAQSRGRCRGWRRRCRVSWPPDVILRNETDGSGRRSSARARRSLLSGLSPGAVSEAMPPDRIHHRSGSEPRRLSEAPMLHGGLTRAFGRLSDGAVSERPKVQLSKSCVVQATVGSNPTRSAARYTAGAG